MSLTIEYTKDPILLSFIASISLGIFVSYFTEKIIKKHYPEVFQILGSPNVIKNNTKKNTLRYLKFLFTFEFRHLSAGRVNILCLLDLLIMIVSLFLFATYIVTRVIN